MQPAITTPPGRRSIPALRYKSTTRARPRPASRRVSPSTATGAIYNVNYPGDINPTPNVPPPTAGDFVNPQDGPVNGWNTYRIDVQGDVIRVNLNGQDT